MTIFCNLTVFLMYEPWRRQSYVTVSPMLDPSAQMKWLIHHNLLCLRPVVASAGPGWFTRLSQTMALFDLTVALWAILKWHWKLKEPLNTAEHRKEYDNSTIRANIFLVHTKKKNLDKARANKKLICKPLGAALQPFTIHS